MKQEVFDNDDVCSDVWLRNNFELEEEEMEKKPIKPVFLKIKNESNEETKAMPETGDKNSTVNLHEENLSKVNGPTKRTNQLRFINSNNIVSKRKNKTTTEKGKFNNTCKKNDQEGSPITNATVSESAETGLCTFKCTECPAKYNTWLRIYLHLRNKHNIKGTMKNSAKYVIKATLHVSKICSEEYLCDSVILENHFKNRHKISLKEYKQQHNCDTSWKVDYNSMLQKGRQSSQAVGNFCKYQCPNCKRTLRSLSTLWSHAKRVCKINVNPQDKTKYIQKVVTHKCLLCSKLLLCDNNVLLKHVNGVHGIRSLKDYTDRTGCAMAEKDVKRERDINVKSSNVEINNGQVGRFCRFSCNQCQYVVTCWTSMREHMKKVHSYNPHEGWSKHISKVVMHKCLICHQKILNDTEFLFGHLKNKHQKTISGYAKEHNLIHRKCVRLTREERKAIVQGSK